MNNFSVQWRNDGRCGEDHPVNGQLGQCDPDGESPCCSSVGECGNSDDHCKCEGCVDYRGGSGLLCVFKNFAIVL